jgi:hypothetical protein
MTMNTQLTLDQLRSMNLYGMANAYAACRIIRQDRIKQIII